MSGVTPFNLDDRIVIAIAECIPYSAKTIKKVLRKTGSVDKTLQTFFYAETHNLDPLDVNLGLSAPEINVLLGVNGAICPHCKETWLPTCKPVTDTETLPPWARCPHCGGAVRILMM